MATKQLFQRPLPELALFGLIASNRFRLMQRPLRNSLRAGAMMLTLHLLSVACASAQDAKILTILVPARGSARSPLINLARSEELIVELSPNASPATVIPFVHDAAGVLICADDADITAVTFSCQPPGPLSVYVLLFNPGDASVQVQITQQRARGAPPETADSAVVRVFFATNRGQNSQAGFSADPNDRLTYGYSDVSIPREHRMGELEGPSIFRLEFRSDANKHVATLQTKIEDQSEFVRRVRERSHTSTKRDAFVFVHGFNVAFSDAIRRTAQMSYDLGFSGPAILFSWPSHESVSPLSYQSDVRNADLSAQALADFLNALRRSIPDIDIHVIAHSMGNRVLIAALDKLHNRKVLGQVALIAPDVDAELFRQNATRISGVAVRVTLYASSADLALKLSQLQAGYPRAGQSGKGILVLPGIDTVDASAVSTDVLGAFHSYYADNTTILSDLFNLFRAIPIKDRFGVSPVSTKLGVYWRFRPAVR